MAGYADGHTVGESERAMVRAVDQVRFGYCLDAARVTTRFTQGANTRDHAIGAITEVGRRVADCGGDRG